MMLSMQQMMLTARLPARLNIRYAGRVKPRRLIAMSVLMLASACGGGEEAAPATNEASRLTEQIQKQGEQIARQADNGAAAIEQALENEGAIVFENRGNLLNEAADNKAAAAPRQ
jgi:hypothetical protein